MVRLLIAAVLVVASSASASVWPTPAAGISASGDPEVVFTFDDGPNATWTPKILDILQAHGIHAAFFVVGEMVGKRNQGIPEIVARMLREGHVIANHTMTHPDLCEIEDPALAAAEIDGGRAAIEKVAGIPIVWFRAPFGARCERLELQLAERAIVHLHWDLDPQEWRSKDPKKVVRYVTKALGRSRARNVLLLHDMNRTTVKALPEILAWITEENARRVLANERPIRIIQAPQLALEQLPAGLVEWTGEATSRLRGLRADLASLLPSAPRLRNADAPARAEHGRAARGELRPTSPRP